MTRTPTEEHGVGLRCPAPPRTDCWPWLSFLFYNPQGPACAAAHDTDIPEANRFILASRHLLMRPGTRRKTAECLGS